MQVLRGWRYLVASLLMLLFCVAMTGAAEPGSAEKNQQVQKMLEQVLKSKKLPGGFVAAVIDHGEIRALAAAGHRKAGSDEPLQANDLMHLGSCTKAMTATLLSMLVAEGQLSWDQTLGELFGEQAVHPRLRKATLRQLVTHQAGLRANPKNFAELPRQDDHCPETRLRVTKAALQEAPQHEPGSEFLYSNVGYIVAGHIIDKVTGSTWEEQMRTRLFDPLGMTSVGFGPVGTPDQVDQPWGHARISDKEFLPTQADNPPVYGPAGTVHCTMEDWARFIGLHLEQPAGAIITPQQAEYLHTPLDGEDYALGWGVTTRPWGKGNIITHTGSNTAWFAVAWVVPDAEQAYLVASNCADGEACDQVASGLILLNAAWNKQTD